MNEIFPLKGVGGEQKAGIFACIFRGAASAKATVSTSMKTVWEKVLKLGRDDPRRICHAFKVGLALTIVTIFYFMRPLYVGMGGNAMWAVITVAVVFEYTVGKRVSIACFLLPLIACIMVCFCLNRAFGTLVAGSLGLGVHYIAGLAGDKGEPIILGASIFLLGIKAKYDYGVLIFMLTFSLVSVSGYREEKLFKLAQERVSTVAVGGSLCLIVSIVICPVWAGGDLHNSIVKNLQTLADSLEGCVEEYFNEEEEGEELKTKDTSGLQGYRTVLDSKAKEELLANLARWEPAHGRFRFLHPWKQYLKVGTATRACAYCVEALNAATNSEYKAPKALRQQLKEPCLKVSSLSSMVLRQLSMDIDSMNRPSSNEPLIDSANDAAVELYTALKSLPQAHPNFHTAHGDTVTGPALMDLLPLANVASILIEVLGRIDVIVSSVEELSVRATFENHLPANATAKSEDLANVNSDYDKQGPHVVVEIKGS
ncbi:Aluminum-activated malate transporter 10 [Nymphaea thermarum]|nr:Aluminum-activated malate transporter 10 [Nymphaea thermarum]